MPDGFFSAVKASHTYFVTHSIHDLDFNQSAKSMSAIYAFPIQTGV